VAEASVTCWHGVSASAQGARKAPPVPTGQSGRAEARPSPDPRACAELGDLRHELARLQHEWRRLEAALDLALRSGNRERARQIWMEIREIKAQIQDVQHQIRRLLQFCQR